MLCENMVWSGLIRTRMPHCGPTISVYGVRHFHASSTVFHTKLPYNATNRAVHKSLGAKRPNFARDFVSDKARSKYVTMTSTYAGDGDLSSAWQSYNNLLKSGATPTLKQVRELAAMYHHRGEHKRALLLIDAVGQFNLQMDAATVHTLSNIVGRSEDENGAHMLFNLIAKQQPDGINATDCAQLCKAFLKNNQLHAAMKLVDWMPTVRIEPNAHMYTMLLAACRRTGDIEQGVKLHKRFQRSRIPMNAYVATTLISLYTNNKRYEEAKQVQSQYANVLMNDPMLSALITMHAGLGDIGNARSLFEANRKIAAESSWTSIIAMLANRDDGMEALKLVKEVFESHQTYCTNHYLLRIMLRVCGEQNDGRLGKRIHDHIRAMKMEDSFYPSLIQMYAGGGAAGLKAAEELFDRWQKHSHKELGCDTWTAMINAYGYHRSIDKAWHTFHQMTKHVKPNALTFTVLLNTCSHAGQVDKGRELIETMEQRYGIRPDIIHHNCMVDLLGRAGQLAEAEQHITRIPEPNLVTYMALLGACRKHQDVERAERVQKIIIERWPRDAPAHVLMASILRVSGRRDDAQVIRQQMSNNKISKIPGRSNIQFDNDDEVHSFMVNDADHVEIAEIRVQADALWERIQKNGYQPVRSHVEHDMSDDEKDVHLCRHSEKLALAYGLMRTDEGTPLTITKNLRVCPDCHAATKFIAKMVARNISVRDINIWHHFDAKTGTCSCNDYW